MYVCMSICMYMCMYVCNHVLMHARMHILAKVVMFIDMGVYSNEEALSWYDLGLHWAALGCIAWHGSAQISKCSKCSKCSMGSMSSMSSTNCKRSITCNNKSCLVVAAT